MPVVEEEVEPVGRGKGDVVGLVAAVAGTAVGCGCPRTPPGLAPPDRVNITNKLIIIKGLTVCFV